MFSIVIEWLSDVPRIEQLKKLKKIYPRLNTIPNNDLLRIMKTSKKWQFAIAGFDEVEI